LKLLLTQLLDRLGPAAVLAGEAVRSRARHTWDPTPLEAAAIVRPASTEQVSLVLALCNEAGQPVVTHGGLTGLCGGDRATAGDIVLSLERMNRIEEIDPLGRTATVEAGCVLEKLQEAVSKQGLFFPLDLGARGSCTIGGNVATNAGGSNVIRYGMMRSLVLGLEAVLADGTVVSSMNRMMKNNTGYDLKQLFIGSEGTLGVVTRVVVALQEAPAGAHTALVAVDDVDKVALLLRHASRLLAGQLTSFEVMWNDFYRAQTAPGTQDAPLGRDHPAYVILETQGVDPAADAERFESAIGAALEQGLVADAVLAKSGIERDRIWAIRENLESAAAEKPMFAYDVSLPIRDMPAYVEQVRARVTARWPDGRFYSFGHMGDGNLHFVICPREAGGQVHAEADAAVYEPLAQYGGAVSAEHGIGLLKRPWLSLSRSASELALMRLLKRSFDPRNILNPGKVLPD